ncbi:hypothetical protein ACFQZQ_11120 [Lysobacter koreensis]|uniref:Lipoprotein n=1 Tax=Lysobacter koreensis TaxID=266122 RepID=A0ABW2YNB3_9GAMM
MIRLRGWATDLPGLLIGLVLLGCKPSASVSAVEASRSRLAVPTPAATESAVTEESGLPKRLTLGSGEGCQRALEILATCAHETSCSAEMTMFLPSASRSQHVLLTRQSWFSPQQFDRYCERACNVKSAEVDRAQFEQDVCAGETAPAKQAEHAEAIALTIDGVPMPTDGFPLDQLIRKLGKPEHIAESKFSCDSAFEEEGTQEYIYPTLTFETDGGMAVLRSMKVVGGNRVALPGVVSMAGYAEAEFQKLLGLKAELLKGHTYRTSIVPGGDFETAYDFSFVHGKLDRVEYWIGC